jgi:hypothetical protein
MTARPAMRTPGGLPGFPAGRPAPTPDPTPPAGPEPELETQTVDDDPPAAPAGPATDDAATKAARPAAPDKPPAKSKRARPAARSATAAEVGEGGSLRLDIELDPKAKYQAQFYGLIALRRHYERLVFELKQDGEPTSLSELFNAVLLHGPATPDEARALLRELRRTPPER